MDGGRNARPVAARGPGGARKPAAETGRCTGMAHFPVPGPAMRIALALILAAGYAAALLVLMVFRSGPCPPPGAGAALLLWAGFAVLELPATFAGPGNRARAFKRAAFALLVGGIVLALVFGPTPDCAGGSARAIGAMVFVLGLAGAGGLALWSRRRLRQDADLGRLGPGERKSDRISRGR